jgi:hypothetical protein
MAELPQLEGPYEILELGDGGKLVLHPQKFSTGTMLIHPRWQPAGKTIKALRVWVPQSDKPLFPDYFDLTAATLVAQVEPILQRSDLRGLELTITKRGVAPKARYEVAVRNV